jgi:hypothetical protein
MTQEERHLEQANRHIVEATERVERQTSLVAGLSRDGHDMKEAEALLETLQQSLALAHEHRELILREIDDQRKL